MLHSWTIPPAWNHKRGHDIAIYGVERALAKHRAGMLLYGLSEPTDSCIHGGALA
jgi:hypothetical protein